MTSSPEKSMKTPVRQSHQSVGPIIAKTTPNSHEVMEMVVLSYFCWNQYICDIERKCLTVQNVTLSSSAFGYDHLYFQVVTFYKLGCSPQVIHCG
jgi:hypothetical protein